MEDNNNENSPIIVKKVKKGDHGHHGGAWKVAYADFVTAMMALFIVLWVLGQSEDVKEAVSGYFKDPIAFSEKSGKIIGSGTGSMSIMNPGPPTEEQLLEYERERLKEMGEQIYEELSSSPEFVGLMDQIDIQIVDEGLRIEILESANDIFFEIGSADLKSNALLILYKIGEELAQLPNKIVLEGHTDSRPYISRGTGYTNFELSADRANNARKALLKGGLPAGRVAEVRGYADRLLRDSDNPYSVVNRRISIIVEYSRNTG